LLFFDNASIVKQIGAKIDIAPPSALYEAGHVHARQHARSLVTERKFE
jgi:hypothetical protein